ncbi:MAG: hypothetical protein GXP27_00250 [Planctomycetes bacterium]|nr:hypothetical protein [Planctomycetota bacterium]
MPHPVDKDNMEFVIQNSPYQFRSGLQAAAELGKLPQGTFRRLLVAGMGGSAMPVTLVGEGGLAAIPVAAHMSYDLPAGVDPSDTLVIASSFSGNTEETISAYETARDQGFALIGISKGGKLQELCEADDVPHVPIPVKPDEQKMQPRSATGYGVGILVGLLDRLGLAASGARETIETLEQHLLNRMEEACKQGEALADQLTAATPIVYASHRYANVARIWKIKFNENAKCPAFWNVFPELNHNEMTGWLHHPGPFHLILLRDPEEDPRVRLREEITCEILKQEAGLDSTDVVMQGQNMIEKMFGTLLVGDWASYHLALRLNEDPSPVKMVETFKGMLEQRRKSAE